MKRTAAQRQLQEGHPGPPKLLVQEISQLEMKILFYAKQGH